MRVVVGHGGARRSREDGEARLRDEPGRGGRPASPRWRSSGRRPSRSRKAFSRTRRRKPAAVARSARTGAVHLVGDEEARRDQTGRLWLLFVVIE